MTTYGPGALLRRLLPAMVTAIILGASVPAAADAIQIGTFTWDAVTEEQDEFLLFCGGVEPCSRFTLTNDLGILTPTELAAIGLPSADIPFENVMFPDVVAGSLGSLMPGGSFVWVSADPINTATVAFEIAGLIGNLLFPTLTGPWGGPAAILVEYTPETTPPPVAIVPEPATIALVTSGLFSACLWRRTRARVRA